MTDTLSDKLRQMVARNDELDAARGDAWDAAWAAERKVQAEIFKEIFGEEK